VSYFKLVCIVILITMCRILYQYVLFCFLKFVVREMNSKMVKSGMVVLTRREKADADGI
jgi:hypothetical protein